MEKETSNTLTIHMSKCECIIIVMMILGFFIYEKTIEGALAILLFVIVPTIVTIVGIVPVIGFILVYMINHIFIYPYLFNITGVYETWLTTSLFVVQMILSFVFTLYTTWYLFFRERIKFL